MSLPTTNYKYDVSDRIENCAEGALYCISQGDNPARISQNQLNIEMASVKASNCDLCIADQEGNFYTQPDGTFRFLYFVTCCPTPDTCSIYLAANNNTSTVGTMLVPVDATAGLPTYDGNYYAATTCDDVINGNFIKPSSVSCQGCPGVTECPMRVAESEECPADTSTVFIGEGVTPTSEPFYGNFYFINTFLIIYF